MLIGERLEGAGIKGMIFDCYGTLIDIKTDEESLTTYDAVSNWLIYQGIRISSDELMNKYKRTVDEELERSGQKYPEVKLEGIFTKICGQYANSNIHGTTVGVEIARTFRAASLKQLKVLPNSLRLLKKFNGYPMAIVSNGQRAFSEPELRYLGLHSYFKFVIFSSDVGYQKPDPRIFMSSTEQLGLKPREILFIGDSFDNDITPAERLGMKAMHINEACKFFHAA